MEAPIAPRIVPRRIRSQEMNDQNLFRLPDTCVQAFLRARDIHATVAAWCGRGAKTEQHLWNSKADDECAAIKRFVQCIAANSIDAAANCRRCDRDHTVKGRNAFIGRRLCENRSLRSRAVGISFYEFLSAERTCPTITTAKTSDGMASTGASLSRQA
jgi:predicted secreted Zn-dependent protease